MFKNHFRWIVLGSIIFVIGIIILNTAGRFFIGEIIQEVPFRNKNTELQNAFVGGQAPVWDLRDMAGNNVSLSDFQGDPLVVTFWASWNPLSIDQIKIFDEYLSREGSRDLFKIITINNQEDKSVVSSFSRRSNYTLTILLDENGAVGELYGVKNLPTTYFINRHGEIKDAFVGVLSEEVLDDKVQKIIQ